MKDHLISIIMPCYNQGQFLEETFQSVFNQTYKNWECLLINDGSTDTTKEIAEKWSRKDKRFRYFEKENGGRSSARNLGLEFAEGEYIQLLDADDLLHPEKFQKSIEVFKKTDCDVVITNFLRFRKTILKTKRAFCDLQNQQYSFESILLGWDVKFSIPIHCGIFKHEIIKGIRFNLQLNAYEDWFFWLESYKRVNQTNFINENLVYYRLNPKGTTVNYEHMHENLKKSYFLIYNSLEEKHKTLFFERVTNELLHAKNEYKEFKDNVFYRKWFYNLKKLFK